MKLTITQTTTRGSSDRVVPAGTQVTVVAIRKDPDGVKLLVGLGKGTGSKFQVPASHTDWSAS
jgi:hypothetical protein